MNRYTMILLAAVVAVLAAAPKSTWADALNSNFGPHTKRMGFCLRPTTVKLTSTEPTNSDSFGNSNVNNHTQPNNLPVNDYSSSTWFPQPNTTRVVSNPHCPPPTPAPEWGSTLLFLGVDLAGFMTLASLTGLVRRKRILALLG
jgi:hypothetical protein